MTKYTIFQQTGSGPSALGDFGGYTMTMQFSLTAPGTLTAIWWNSPTGVSNLPNKCGIFTVAGTAIVAGSENDSPSWSGAAGSGWVKCSYPGTLTLAKNTQYRVAVAFPSGPAYGGTNNYWTSGPGASGIVNGPLKAPNSAGTDVGQDAFVTGGASLVYPTTTNGGNYWVDVEVNVTTTGTGIPGHFFPFGANATPGWFPF